MNSESGERPARFPKNSAGSNDSTPLPQYDGPADVPVFSCLVYVARTEQGDVRARVANLAGIECEASSEREALGQIVPAFKQQVAELLRSEQGIPWIDPPIPANPEEQQRWIPVHL